MYTWTVSLPANTRLTLATVAHPTWKDRKAALTTASTSELFSLNSLTVLYIACCEENSSARGYITCQRRQHMLVTPLGGTWCNLFIARLILKSPPHIRCNVKLLDDVFL